MDKKIKSFIAKIFKVTAVVIGVLTLLCVIMYFLAIAQLITNERAGIKNASNMQLKGFERLVGWGKHYLGTDKEGSYDEYQT